MPPPSFFSCEHVMSVPEHCNSCRQKKIGLLILIPETFWPCVQDSVTSKGYQNKIIWTERILMRLTWGCQEGSGGRVAGCAAHVGVERTDDSPLQLGETLETRCEAGARLLLHVLHLHTTSLLYFIQEQLGVFIELKYERIAFSPTYYLKRILTACYTNLKSHFCSQGSSVPFSPRGA